MARDPQTKCTRSIGCYASEEDAARAYDWAAVQAHGPDAKRNFPGETISELPESLVPSIARLQGRQRTWKPWGLELAQASEQSEQQALSGFSLTPRAAAPVVPRPRRSNRHARRACGRGWWGSPASEHSAVRCSAALHSAVRWLSSFCPSHFAAHWVLCVAATCNSAICASGICASGNGPCPLLGRGCPIIGGTAALVSVYVYVVSLHQAQLRAPAPSTQRRGLTTQPRRPHASPSRSNTNVLPRLVRMIRLERSRYSASLHNPRVGGPSGSCTRPPSASNASLELAV
jgi:hypothetical protein